MAMISVSLDTLSRQVVLTVNSVLVPSSDFLVEKYMFDGEEIVRFHYTVEMVNQDGLKERRQFFLPSIEDLATVAHNGLNNDGLADKTVHDDEKAKADIIDFMKPKDKS